MTSQEIAKATEAFLNNGGSIQKIDAGDARNAWWVATDFVKSLTPVVGNAKKNGKWVNHYDATIYDFGNEDAEKPSA